MIDLANAHEARDGRALAWAVAHRWSLAVSGATLGWTITLCAIAFDRFLAFRLFGYDLGNMVQAVWSTAHGRPLELTNGATGEQMVRLGLHADPILAALAPFWLAVPSPLTLVAVQIAAVALGALPVFWLGRRHLGSERVAALLALTYLVYPWTAWAALDVFHPVVLAIPLFLYAVWYLDGDRLVPFALCAILAAAAGELMGLVVAALGIWYALARGRRAAGLGIAAAGAAWTLVAVYAVVPLFAGGDSVFFGAFESVGGSPTGAARVLFTDPATILQAMTSDRDLIYLLALAVPLGGAFLLAPALAAVAVPQLAVNLLTDLGAPTYPHLHYVAAILPFLVAATVVGLGRLSHERRMIGAVAVLAISLAAALVAGPWPGSLGGRPAWWERDVPPERAEALRDAVSLVPAGAAVSSTSHVRAHLAEREYLASVPRIGRAEWIVVEASDTWIPRAVGGASDPAALQEFLVRIERSVEWTEVFERNGVHVFRRSSG